jgi:hypothetical protein
MYKNATKCNETIGKWCKTKHGASKIIDTFETYQSPSWVWLFPGFDIPWFLTEGKLAAVLIKPSSWGFQLDGDLHYHIPPQHLATVRAPSRWRPVAGELPHGGVRHRRWWRKEVLRGMVHNMLSIAPVAPGGVVVGARMRTGWRRRRGGWASAWWRDLSFK